MTTPLNVLNAQHTALVAQRAQWASQKATNTANNTANNAKLDELDAEAAVTQTTLEAAITAATPPQS